MVPAASALEDPLFRYLVKFAVVENYFKRVVPIEGSIADGTENHSLIAPLILRNLPEYQQFVKQQLHFELVESRSLRAKLIREMHKDGAYLMIGKSISNKVYLHNLIPRVLKRYRLNSIEHLQHQFLPSGDVWHTVGVRTLTALCTGLLGGTGYVVKQTASGGTSLGRVAMFDGYGLRAEFFLARQKGINHPVGAYYHPLRGVVGVLSVYAPDKSQVHTRLVHPSELGLDPRKYLDIPERFIAHVKGFAQLVSSGERFLLA